MKMLDPKKSEINPVVKICVHVSQVCTIFLDGEKPNFIRFSIAFFRQSSFEANGKTKAALGGGGPGACYPANFFKIYLV